MFIVELVAVGVLLPGDTLVLDNASVHWSEEIADHLDALLDAAEVCIALMLSVAHECSG